MQLLLAEKPASPIKQSFFDVLFDTSPELRWMVACRVRRALENTCQVLGDDNADGILTYGRGLLQVKADTCCAVLCCAVLCCAVLCCAVLCCAVLSWLAAIRHFNGAMHS